MSDQPETSKKGGLRAVRASLRHKVTKVLGLGKKKDPKTPADEQFLYDDIEPGSFNRNFAISKQEQPSSSTRSMSLRKRKAGTAAGQPAQQQQRNSFHGTSSRPESAAQDLHRWQPESSHSSIYSVVNVTRKRSKANETPSASSQDGVYANGKAPGAPAKQPETDAVRKCLTFSDTNSREDDSHHITPPKRRPSTRSRRQTVSLPAQAAGDELTTPLSRPHLNRSRSASPVEFRSPLIVPEPADPDVEVETEPLDLNLYVKQECNLDETARTDSASTLPCTVIRRDAPPEPRRPPLVVLDCHEPDTNETPQHSFIVKVEPGVDNRKALKEEFCSLSMDEMRLRVEAEKLERKRDKVQRQLREIEKRKHEIYQKQQD